MYGNILLMELLFLTHGTSITPQYVFTSLSIGKLYYFRCYAYKGSTYSEFCEAGQAQTFPQFLLDGNTELWSDHKDAVYDGSNAVSRMVDKSGKNHHLDLFNGSPTKTATGILFDGVDDLLQTSFSFPRPQYAYLIMRYIVNNGKYFADGKTNLSGVLYQGADVAAATSLGYSRIYAGSNGPDSSAATKTGDFFYFRSTYGICRVKDIY